MSLHTFTDVTALDRDQLLRLVTWANRESGEAEVRSIANLFVMIGAVPNTDWLDGCLTLYDKRCVETRRDVQGQALAAPYATTRLGVFAFGDVRSGSVKRVASSVGEGSVVVSDVHQYLNPGVA